MGTCPIRYENRAGENSYWSRAVSRSIPGDSALKKLQTLRLLVIGAASLTFLGVLSYLIRYRLATPPPAVQTTVQQAIYGGWYYGLVVQAQDLAFLGVWLVLLAAAIPRHRLSLLVLMLPLNFAYLYTSETLWGNNPVLVYLQNQTYRVVTYYAPMLSILDYECLGLFAAIMGVVVFVYHAEGTLRLALRLLQVGAISVLPLGLEIYLFLPEDKTMWVASVLDGTMFQWFSNFDLLILAVALIAVTTPLLMVVRPVNPLIVEN